MPGPARDQRAEDCAARPLKRWLLAAFVGLWIVSCLWPPYPHELVLQHIPTLLAVGLLVAINRYQSLTAASYAAVLAFLCLHLLGARYLYSNVPYVEWWQALTSRATTPRGAWHRNHYDRLVHFCYGLLLVGVGTEFLERACRLSRCWATFLALNIILSSSALYELLEGLIGHVLDPAAAEAYNGQQGDMWDAQKDMALALAGAFTAIAVEACWKRIHPSVTPAP